MKFAIISLFLLLFSCQKHGGSKVHVDTVKEYQELQTQFKSGIELIDGEASFDSTAPSLRKGITALEALAKK